MSKRDRVLHMLKEAGPRGVTTAAFLEGGCGSRFGARILELKRASFDIRCERVRQGCYRYTLRAEPARTSPPAPTAPANGRLFEPPPAPPVNAILGWEGDA